RRIKSLRKTKYRTGQPFGQFTSLPLHSHQCDFWN
ncbi:hypothetical protein RRG08_065817, partial [Elysia crispata]